MNTDYKDKRRPFQSRGVHLSFLYALQGIKHALIHERNMRIHFVISAMIIILGLYVQLTLIEWLFICFAIGGVVSLELLNTAIERIVDLVTDTYHPLAKQAKDVSAAAVFVYSLLSVIVGLIIFLPKIF